MARLTVDQAQGLAATLISDSFLAPAAALTAAFLLAQATPTTQVVINAAGLNGSIGAGVLPVARNVTVTIAGLGTAINNSNVLVTGVDVLGQAISESIPITTVGSPGTFAGLLPFASVTSITIPAQAAATATIACGFGNVLGLSRKVKSLGGKLALLQEIANLAIVTTGAVAVPSGSNVGTYTPVLAPNGALNYAATYEAA